MLYSGQAFSKTKTTKKLQQKAATNRNRADKQHQRFQHTLTIRHGYKDKMTSFFDGKVGAVS